MKKYLIAAVALFSIACGQGFDYSEGNRAGTINKFSKKGLFCKTWEGEMLLGGYRAGENGVVANLWQFSVIDDSLVPEVAAALESGHRVKLTYRQGMFTGPCISSSDYFVTRVDKLE